MTVIVDSNYCDSSKVYICTYYHNNILNLVITKHLVDKSLLSDNFEKHRPMYINMYVCSVKY